MYAQKIFQEQRVDVLHELIRRRPFGALVAMTADGLQASHAPFVIDPQPAPYGTLRCHLARANSLWQSIAEQPQVLVVFQDVESYISPSWYASKREHGKVVPTWNYAVVHANGPARIVHDASWLRSLLEALTNQHEQHRAEPWHVADAPADYIDKLLGAIVGVEIPIARLQGSWKLSQNRSAADRQGVVAGLQSEGTEAATLMAGMMAAGVDESPKG